MNLQKKTKSVINRESRNLGKTDFRRFAILLMAMALVISFIGCAKDAEEIADEKGGVTAQQIIENPDAYIGKEVTVSGDVEEIHSPRSFNMDSGTSVGELLIVGREPFPQLPDAGDRVYVINDVATVTGVVRKFAAADIEREIGWMDADLGSKFDGKTVLVANSVTFKPGAGTATTQTTTTTGNTNGTMAVDNNNMNTTAADNTAKSQNDGDAITALSVYENAQDKGTLAGRKADFSGVKVNRIVGPHTFTIGSGDNELYVMLDDDAARAVGTQGKIDLGDTVNLSGTIEKLTVAEINDTANDRFRKLTATERDFMKNAKSVYLNVSKISEVGK